MVKKQKEIPFIITLSYLAGFLFIRTSVFIAGAAESEFAQAAKLGELPGVDFYIGRNIILFGYHIHHFYIGFAMICIAGWFAIAGTNYFSMKQLAVVYGFGLGLFFDEIGLLLTWGDYYSQLSYLLTVFLAGVFLNIVFFHDFWVSVRKNVASASPHSVFWITLKNRRTINKIIDTVSDKTGKTERTSSIFTGFLYVLIAFLIYFHPQTVRYWVSIIFIIQGVDYLIKTFK